jgi:hypothetical protein
MHGWDRLTIYLESTLGERLREYCHRNRVKLTEFVRQAVKEKLDREEGLSAKVRSVDKIPSKSGF